MHSRWRLLAERGAVRRAVWQGLLLGPVLLVVFVGSWGAWYLGTWDRDPQWHEVWRHAHRPYVAIERWIRFRWVHFDSQYWIVPVRLDRGPVVLEGLPPDALYWSITWYAWTEVNGSVSSESVQLEPDGSYRVVLSVDEQPRNWIAVPPEARRAVIYLRAYEPAHAWPVLLPTVTQGQRTLVAGGAW